MGKSTICIYENKDADQLRSNCETDRYMNSAISLLLISNQVTVQADSYKIWPETQIVGFLMHWLIMM